MAASTPPAASERSGDGRVPSPAPSDAPSGAPSGAACPASCPAPARAGAAPPQPGPPLAKGGFTIREYEVRVWDMARHVLHPTFLYVLAVVAAGTRLTAHPLLDRPGVGGWIEAGLFLAAFLGAWACFYSTLLRDAGLPSLTITVLVPLAVVAAAAVFLAFPPPASMSAEAFAAAVALLVGPGPVGWAVTMVRWRRHRRAAAPLLGGDTTS